MKKIFTLILIASIAIAETPENQADETQKYLDMKAYEAIIHDAYYEAKPYEGEIPQSWKDAVAKFGYK
jgi:hypothetical protein